MTRPRGTATWAGLLLVGAVVECVALRRQMHEHTLSHATRTVFRTHTPSGRAAFILGWASLTAWFLPHILKAATEVSCGSTSVGPCPTTLT